jgi:hypothetical protein
MKPFLIALSFVAAVSAGAVTIAPGDVAVAPHVLVLNILQPPPPPMYLLDSGGANKGTLPNYWAFGAFGPDNHVFLVGSFSNQIDEYDPSFNLVRTIGQTFYTAGTAGLLIAPNGDFYVLDRTCVLYILSPAGQLKATLALPTSGSGQADPSFDLAAEGCTVLYTDVAEIGRRFNACTGTALANLPGGPASVVRALADGGFVTVHAITLDFYDTTDRLVRTFNVIRIPYPFPDDKITDLRFDSDPRYLWVAATVVYKVRIGDGTVTLSAGPGSSQPPQNLAVNGEQRPTVAGVAASRRRIAPRPSR